MRFALPALENIGPRDRYLLLQTHFILKLSSLAVSPN